MNDSQFPILPHQEPKFSVKDYHYDLPQELIAQHPMEPRDASRLMIIDRKTGEIKLSFFNQLCQWIDEDFHLIFNDTKVIPARLFCHKSSGARIEILLLRPLQSGEWKVMGRPGRKLPLDTVISFGPDFSATVTAIHDDGTRNIMFHTANFEEMLEKYGEMPLPHYIHREDGLDEEKQKDKQTYQTVYAANPGGVAAPTAGLHFTENILDELKKRHVSMSKVTLHTGAGTFKPVQVEDIRDHKMHIEHYHINKATAEELNSSKKKKLCVGTTSCRALESAADEEGKICAGDFETSIFIYPGYLFKTTNALLTNFHLPQSTLLMLVSAFAGYELVMKAYRYAVEEKFRFFSYGDAMLIL